MNHLNGDSGSGNITDTGQQLDMPFPACNTGLYYRPESRDKYRLQPSSLVLLNPQQRDMRNPHLRHLYELNYLSHITSWPILLFPTVPYHVIRLYDNQ